MKLGVFDSGIGGWTIFSQLIHDLENSEFIYYADHAFAPYSEKSSELIIERAKIITAELLQLGATCIVVACNTATVIALEALRREWPNIPFVGTVPAIGPAVRENVGEKILVLATKNTIASEYLSDLIDPYKNSSEFILRGSTRLVEYIEDEAWQQAYEELRNLTRDTQGVRAVVLGCTHFPLVLSELRQVLSPLVSIYTPHVGVCQQTIRILLDYEKRENINFSQINGRVKSSSEQKIDPVFLSSGDYTSVELQEWWQRLQPRLQSE